MKKSPFLNIKKENHPSEYIKIKENNNVQTDDFQKNDIVKNVGAIFRQVADMLSRAEKETPPAEIKYRPEVMIVIINPQAPFFEPIDPEIQRAEIAAQREREKAKSKTAEKEPPQKSKSKSKSKFKDWNHER